MELDLKRPATQQPHPIPSQFVDKVAVDSGKKVLYVEHRSTSDPIILSWVERNKAIGHHFTISPCSFDKLVELRNSGLRQQVAIDDDQRVRADAIRLITAAAEYKASDLHLMMRGEHTEIQVEVMGGLRVLSMLNQDEGEALARAIYQGLATTRDTSYNSLEFQNAQIPGEVFPPHAMISSIRVVRGPCHPQVSNGAFMTLRLQYHRIEKGQAAQTKRKLEVLPAPRAPEGNLELTGYTGRNLENLRQLMSAPAGMVIFTGPTGSGKTTSLFEVLQEKARTNPERRLVTIEDPVEYPMSWAVQMAVTNARDEGETGKAYADRLRVALRMAPKGILLGELRDADVAVTAVVAAVTGHQVWTTMHVTDPFLFAERLEFMDERRLARRIFCDEKIVRGVIAQRLLPELCPSCSIPLAHNESLLPQRLRAALASHGPLKRVRLKGSGCTNCNHSGSVSRFAVAEVIVFDAELMHDLIEHGSTTARMNYRARKGAEPSMLEAGIKYALNGVIDPRSIEDCIDTIAPREMNAAITPIALDETNERSPRLEVVHAG